MKSLPRIPIPRYALLLLVVLLLLHAFPVLGQHYHMRTYREQDGVASNYVFSAAQDSLGNMWFGTRNGACLYTGADWETIGRDQQPGPRGEGVVAISDAGTIWWVARRLPLRVLQLTGDHWMPVPAKILRSDFHELADVVAWSNSDGVPCLAAISRAGQLAYWDGSLWRKYLTQRAGEPLYSLSRARGRLLVAGQDGVSFFDLENIDAGLQPLDWDLPNSHVRGLGHTRDTGVTWVVGDNWCARLVGDRIDEVFDVGGLPPRNRFLGASVAEAPDGGVYIVEPAGVHVFDPGEGLETITPAVELVSGGGLEIFIDRENNVWLPSGRGIHMIPSRRLACFNHRHGLIGDEVSAILERADGSLLLGQSQGITVFDRTPKAMPYESPDWPNGRIADLVEGPDGRVWAAANRKGVGRVRADGSVDWQALAGIRSVGIYSLGFHPDFGMLVGTSSGLYAGEPGQEFHRLELPTGGPKRNIVVRRIVPLARGRVGIATNREGIFVLDGQDVEWYPGDDDQLSYSSYAIHETAEGRLLVGTDAGLYHVSGNRLERSAAPEPEIRRPVYSILLDHEGTYWFGTDNGVSVWDGRVLNRVTADDGLLGHETNRDALVETRDGRILIGTDSGLSIYRRKFDIAPTVAPVLSLTAVIVNGSAQPVDQPIRRVGPIGSLVLNFRAPSFSSKQNIEFRARLVGEIEDSLPLQVHSPGTLPLTNVPSGSFRIQIQARTPDGRESGVLTTPLIEVVPPLRDRWYMRAAVAASILLALWLVFAYVSGRRHARRLEDEVRRRTSDLRRREAAAVRETERLTGILESISDGVVVIDDQTRVVLYNGAAENALPDGRGLRIGMSLEDVLPPAALIDPGQRERYLRLLSSQEAIGVPSEPIAIQVSEGEIFWIEVTAVPVGIEDAGMVIAFRDITNRRRLEHEKRRTQKLESLGLLAGGIAHDFNNLLTILLGNLTLIETSPAAGPYEKNLLGRMRHATERARSLTRQLLTFARGGGPVREPADLVPVLRDAVAFGFSDTNVTFDLDVPEDLWWAEVDSGQIHQVFNNLAINAFQAMPDGGAVRISARNVPESADGPDRPQVVIEVRDHGVGIAEADLARIFDPYFSTKQDGSGLGLAISHSIIEKHGGCLTVESLPGVGSTFRIELPACVDAGVEIGAKQPVPSESSNSPEPSDCLRVLVMDDEKEIQTVLSSMLIRCGNDCVCASNGEEAVRHFSLARRAVPFDCVILDLTVPAGMGGLETLEELRAIDPDIQAIVTSGYNSDPVLSDHRRYGFQGILRKPFTLEDLDRALEQVR